MRYDICSACQYFHPRLLTLEENIPKHCTNPYYADYFGKSAGGFPSGIDIIHCDCFTQIPIDYGDVKALLDKDRNLGVSYVLTSPRNFKALRVPQLYDNKQNIKTHYLTDFYNYENRTKIKQTLKGESRPQ